MRDDVKEKKSQTEKIWINMPDAPKFKRMYSLLKGTQFIARCSNLCANKFNTKIRKLESEP